MARAYVEVDTEIGTVIMSDPVYLELLEWRKEDDGR